MSTSDVGRVRKSAAPRTRPADASTGADQLDTLADPKTELPPARPARSGSSLVVARVRPAYQQVAGQLTELILRGELNPGDRLPTEGELAGQFGVSRSTVREALRVLSSRDLLVTLRGTTGGTFIKTIDPAQVREYLQMSIGLMSDRNSVAVEQILEAREMLEAPAARLAALRRTDADVLAMQETVARETRTRGRDLKFQENRNFHGVVVDATGNPLLNLLSDSLFRVLQGRHLRADVPEKYWRQVDKDHLVITDHIAARRAEEAEAAMREHLGRVREGYR